MTLPPVHTTEHDATSVATTTDTPTEQTPPMHHHVLRSTLGVACVGTLGLCWFAFELIPVYLGTVLFWVLNGSVWSLLVKQTFGKHEKNGLAALILIGLKLVMLGGAVLALAWLSPLRKPELQALLAGLVTPLVAALIPPPKRL